MLAKKVRVARSSDVSEGQLLRARVEDQRILLARVGGRIHAVIDRCPHLGLSLARGSLSGTAITCPWHNSRFDFCTGANLDWANAVLGVPMPRWTHQMLAMGRTPGPLTTVAAEEIDGEVYVST